MGCAKINSAKKSLLKVINYQKAFAIWSQLYKKIVTIIGNKTYKTF